jgi:hypothetical protein
MGAHASSDEVAPTRVVAAWIAAGIVAAILALVSALLPDEPASVPISAAIHSSGDVSFMLSGRPSAATSPACGCTHSHVPGGWRGIVVPAQELTLARHGVEPEGATQYDISSSAPESIGALPQKLGIGLQMAVFGVSKRDLGKNPLTLRRTRLLQFVEPFKTDWLSVIASGPLHVASYATEPVAAFSPPDSRWVTVHYPTESGNDSLSMSTSFNPTADPDGRDGADGYPILDVLGPEVVMWAPIDGVRYPATPSEWQGQLPAKEAESFQLDVALWPTDAPKVPRGLVPEIVIRTRAPLFAARLAMRPSKLKAKPESFESVGGAGTVSLSIPNIQRNAAKLVPRFAAADRSPRFRLYNLSAIPNTQSATIRRVGEGPGEATYEGIQWEEFEYPPTPPVAGINVFGRIADLRFVEATADMTIGTKPESYKAPTPLEFRDIQGKGVVGRHMVIPVRVNGREAKINVIGEADTRINSEPVAEKRPWIAQALSDEKVSWFLGLVGALSFVNGVRMRPWRKRSRAA